MCGQVNYSRELVNLRGELKETLTCFLCDGKIKDQGKLTKLKSAVQELEESSLYEGSGVGLILHTCV